MSAQGGALGIGTASDEVQGYTVHELEKEAFDRKTSSSDPSVQAEKGEVFDVQDREAEDDNEDVTVFLTHEEQFPIDPDAEEETQQFTIRAVFVGCCLGGVIAASKYVQDTMYHWEPY